jgi:hypothetical protein
VDPSTTPEPSPEAPPQAPRRALRGWTWEDLHYGSVEHRVHVSRKERPCDTCPEPILPGQRYVHVVWTFPWTLVADDVDDEGRAIGSPAGEWATANVHHSCVRSDYEA